MNADRHLSHGILPNAATMVVICPTLIGLIKLIEADGAPRWADESLGLVTVTFVISALTSYASIRNCVGNRHSLWLERVADLFFMICFVSLDAVSLLFTEE